MGFWLPHKVNPPTGPSAMRARNSPEGVVFRILNRSIYHPSVALGHISLCYFWRNTKRSEASPSIIFAGYHNIDHTSGMLSRHGIYSNASQKSETNAYDYMTKHCEHCGARAPRKRGCEPTT